MQRLKQQNEQNIPNYFGTFTAHWLSLVYIYMNDDKRQNDGKKTLSHWSAKTLVLAGVLSSLKRIGKIGSWVNGIEWQ